MTSLILYYKNTHCLVNFNNVVIHILYPLNFLNDHNANNHDRPTSKHCNDNYGGFVYKFSGHVKRTMVCLRMLERSRS